MVLPVRNKIGLPNPVTTLAEIFALELSLYAATRDAEWQLSCHGLCEDAVLAEQFTSLAGIIDSVLGQLEAAGSQCVQWLSDTKAISVRMSSRRGCYRQLYMLHRQLMSHFEALTKSLPVRIGLLSVAQQAIAAHAALSERLYHFLKGEKEQATTNSFAGSGEPAMLFYLKSNYYENN